MEALKTFVATFPGRYIGGSAVVVARNLKAAKLMMQRKYKKELGSGIHLDRIDMYEIDTTKLGVIIIDDGDY